MQQYLELTQESGKAFFMRWHRWQSDTAESFARAYSLASEFALQQLISGKSA